VTHRRVPLSSGLTRYAPTNASPSLLGAPPQCLSAFEGFCPTNEALPRPPLRHRPTNASLYLFCAPPHRGACAPSVGFSPHGIFHPAADSQRRYHPPAHYRKSSGQPTALPVRCSAHKVSSAHTRIFSKRWLRKIRDSSLSITRSLRASPYQVSFAPSSGRVPFKTILQWHKVHTKLYPTLATGPKVRGFKPGRGRWIFKGDKNP
jgi:hypothetical protein